MRQIPSLDGPGKLHGGCRGGLETGRVLHEAPAKRLKLHGTTQGPPRASFNLRLFQIFRDV